MYRLPEAGIAPTISLFTQCFESARQAGLLRYSYSADRDLYVAGDLYENDVVPFLLKYQLPNDDLDSLISVTTVPFVFQLWIAVGPSPLPPNPRFENPPAGGVSKSPLSSNPSCNCPAAK